MARSGALPAAVLDRVRAEFLASHQFNEGNSSQEDDATLLRMLMAFEEAAFGVTEAEARAEYRRRQIRERTALLGKRPRDGGNSD